MLVGAGIVQGLQAKYDLVTANPPYILPGDRPDFLPLSFVQRWSCPVARKLPAHSQRRYCYYELRGGPREFAQTASRSLSEEGKFCIVHALPCMLRAGACTPVYRARRGLRRANDEQTGRPLKDSCQVASRSADVDRSLADVGLKTVRRLTAFSRGEPKLGTNRTVL